jgi:hypothetical protein
MLLKSLLQGPARSHRLLAQAAALAGPWKRHWIATSHTMLACGSVECVTMRQQQQSESLGVQTQRLTAAGASGLCTVCHICSTLCASHVSMPSPQHPMPDHFPDTPHTQTQLTLICGGSVR